MQNTTAFTLTGLRITRELGTVRGIVVRSRSIVGTIGAGLQTIFGGDITLYTQMCEHARQDAYERMCAHASALPYFFLRVAYYWCWLFVSFCHDSYSMLSP